MSAELSTRYLGLELRNPLVAAASPLTGHLEMLEQLQEAGAAAVVLPSLFQEQIEHEEVAIHRMHEFGAESFPEALTYLPELDSYNTGPERYLRLVEDAKRRLDIPVIASLNGSSLGGWVRHGRLLEEAGADALELNIFYLASDGAVSGAEVEKHYLELVEAVRREVSLPLAVKMGPFFSSLAHFARRVVAGGADGLVLFNRFMQPDIDLEHLEVTPAVVLSRSWESRLPLRWIAILSGRIECSLAATSGAHSAADVLKLLLAGADAVALASSLLEHGPGRLAEILTEMRHWLVEQEYASIEQLKGSMSHRNCPDPGALERAHYMEALRSYSGKFI